MIPAPATLHGSVQVIIECPGGLVPGKVPVERNGRLTAKQRIKAGDQLPDRFFPALPGIPEADGAADQFFRAPDHVTHLLDLGKGGRSAAKVFPGTVAPAIMTRQADPVHLLHQLRIVPELVDGEVPDGKAAGGKRSGNRPDIR